MYRFEVLTKTRDSARQHQFSALCYLINLSAFQGFPDLCPSFARIRRQGQSSTSPVQDIPDQLANILLGHGLVGESLDSGGFSLVLTDHTAASGTENDRHLVAKSCLRQRSSEPYFCWKLCKLKPGWNCILFFGMVCSPLEEVSRQYAILGVSQSEPLPIYFRC